MNRRRMPAAFLLPRIARAQPPVKFARIGILGNGDNTIWSAFFSRMRELGYVEGRTVAYERQWSQGVAVRFPAAECLAKSR